MVRGHGRSRDGEHGRRDGGPPHVPDGPLAPRGLFHALPDRRPPRTALPAQHDLHPDAVPLQRRADVHRARVAGGGPPRGDLPARAQVERRAPPDHAHPSLLRRDHDAAEPAGLRLPGVPAHGVPAGGGRGHAGRRGRLPATGHPRVPRRRRVRVWPGLLPPGRDLHPLLPRGPAGGDPLERLCRGPHRLGDGGADRRRAELRPHPDPDGACRVGPARAHPVDLLRIPPDAAGRRRRGVPRGGGPHGRRTGRAPPRGPRVSCLARQGTRVLAVEPVPADRRRGPPRAAHGLHGQPPVPPLRQGRHPPHPEPPGLPGAAGAGRSPDQGRADPGVGDGRRRADLQAPGHSGPAHRRRRAGRGLRGHGAGLPVALDHLPDGRHRGAGGPVLSREQPRSVRHRAVRLHRSPVRHLEHRAPRRELHVHGRGPPPRLREGAARGVLHPDARLPRPRDGRVHPPALRDPEGGGGPAGRGSASTAAGGARGGATTASWRRSTRWSRREAGHPSSGIPRWSPSRGWTAGAQRPTSSPCRW